MKSALVVGYVQSGKTTHYTSLACKALDAGYQVVVILAGIHNSLRSQTQERIDRHLVGRDSAARLASLIGGVANSASDLTGVGKEDLTLGKPAMPVTVLTCTTSDDNGDFKASVANQVGYEVSQGSRIVMVVKKNATILKNLTRWLRAVSPGAVENRRIAAPALVIDDEADHASINTARDPDADPTTINKLIRKLLASFDRVGFVGYTATPFANIFISSGASHEKLGDDLFPKSFIINLKAPSNYIGPGLVFGHPGDESVGLPQQLPLPMHVQVDDVAAWIPDRHKKTHVPGPIPTSLKRATWLFVMVCAARACRGDRDVHNSMLVHATRFVDVQDIVAQQVEGEVDALRNVLGLGASVNVREIEDKMRETWQERMVQSHAQFQEKVAECQNLPEWDAIWGNVPAVLRRITVNKFNGSSRDALNYWRSPDGLYVIAIGGDKLSRGLTLEGLSISYFLRTSRMFDTLMQMGRWFGYRPRYIDLCRVYTPNALYRAFREIALAFDDLRQDLDYMADVNRTPEEFGLRVRTPSDGLLITAANKIRRGQNVAVRFAGTHVQALDIAREGERADENRAAVRRLIEGLGPSTREVRGRKTAHHLWHDAPVERVLDFLGNYEAFSSPCFYGRCEPLRRYIHEQVSHDELTSWTIVVVSKGQPKQEVSIGALNIGLVLRKESENSTVDRFHTQGVVGSADEALDLSADEFDRARGGDTQPKRESARTHRPSQRGLMLLYLIEDADSDSNHFVPSVAVSFPQSSTAKPLTYTVNEIWLAKRGLVPDDDE